jgi:putative oxidoreductase
MGLGIMFIYHGLPKLMGGVQTWESLGGAMGTVKIHFLPVLWGLLCALVETFGGFLIAIGLVFRPVCLLLLIDLVIASLSQWMPHHDLSAAAHPIEDAIVFAGLLFVGPGKYSVDRK